MFNISDNVPFPEEIREGKYLPGISNKKAVILSNRNRAHPERALARANNEPRYESRTACVEGHGNTRYTSTGCCVVCSKLKCEKLRIKNPEHAKLQARKNWIKNQYGLSMETYNSMIKSQNNKCAICEVSLDFGIHVDHCHNSGKIRALLCPSCNKGIGHFFNSYNILTKAAKYCKDHE